MDKIDRSMSRVYCAQFCIKHIQNICFMDIFLERSNNMHLVKDEHGNVMHHHHIDDPQADSYQPQLFSGLDFELLYASSRSQEV